MHKAARIKTRWTGFRSIPVLSGSALAVVLAGLFLTGCAGTPSAITRLELEPDNYEAVFDAAVQALRQDRFRIDRVDRRLGVITTELRDSGSVVEPWSGDRATPSQAIESTLHYQRRVVRIEFRPRSSVETGGGAEAGSVSVGPIAPEPPLFEPGRHTGLLRLDLRCYVERQHVAGRRIETTSLRESSISVDPSWARRGITPRFWEPIGRDPVVEQRLLARVAAISVAPVDVYQVPATEER